MMNTVITDIDHLSSDVNTTKEDIRGINGPFNDLEANTIIIFSVAKAYFLLVCCFGNNL